MAYVRTGGETQMGLGHSREACCAECTAGKACGAPSWATDKIRNGIIAPSAQGDLFEFKMSSIFPWLLLLGVGYIVFKSPETHGHLAGTARSELGRAHGAVLAKYKRHRTKQKLGRYRRGR